MSWARPRYDHCVITGASSGLGAEFARQLATRAKQLTLVARRADRLEQLAAELRARHGIAVELAVHDLSTVEGADALVARLLRDGSLAVDLLVNNAGFGRHARYRDDSWEVQREMVLLNCVTPVHLIRALWDQWAATPGRGVINVASTAAFQPLPYFAMYGATKALLRSFSLGVGEEARALGIRCLVLCPGPVPTEFGQRADSPARLSWLYTTAEQVVAQALRAYAQGRRQTIPGRINWLTAMVAQRMPLRVVLPAAAASVKPRGAGRSDDE
jgi:short-subunit dehydrogenase